VRAAQSIRFGTGLFHCPFLCPIPVAEPRGRTRQMLLYANHIHQTGIPPTIRDDTAPHSPPIRDACLTVMESLLN
jgi:hypothetical protein